MTSPATDPRLFQAEIIAVTGGGSGLGRRYCLDLAAAGARVLVVGRGDNVHTTAAAIRDAGGDARACRAAVDDGATVVAAALDWAGRLDGLALNAGHVQDRSFAKMSTDEWRDVIQVHLNAAFALASAAWPHLAAAPAGRLVLTTSGAGLHGNFGQVNYAAAKAGLIGLMKTLSIEGARHGIKVNAVAPMAATAMTNGIFDQQVAAALSDEGVSPFVMALLHPGCEISGQILEVGAGWAGVVRWQRSQGLRVGAGAAGAAEVLAGWDQLLDFERGSDHPTSVRDSLRGALPHLFPTA